MVLRESRRTNLPDVGQEKNIYLWLMSDNILLTSRPPSETTLAGRPDIDPMYTPHFSYLEFLWQDTRASSQIVYSWNLIYSKIRGVSSEIFTTRREAVLRSGSSMIWNLRSLESWHNISKKRGCEEPKYQEEMVLKRMSVGWSSGNGVVKSGNIWVGLWSKKSGGWGERGGIAQIIIASLWRTMTAVFVAITYQKMS